MLNINQVTSSLASMPDQALQQFATMHKSDPYMLSLAMSESSRRKQLRTAMTPQPGAAPKVVDQAIADMSPQEYFDDTADASASGQAVNGTGIAALPAGDMEFASGGIVSFEEGGSTYGEQMRNVGGFFLDGLGNLVKTVVGYPGYGLSRDAAPPDLASQAGLGRGSYEGFDPQAAAVAAGKTTQTPYTPAPTSPMPAGAAQGAPGAGMPATQRVAAPATAAPQTGLADMYRKLMGSRVDEIRGDMDKREADYAANRPPSEDYSEHKALLGEDTFDRDKEHAQGLALLAAAGAIAQGGQTTLQSLVAGATEGGKAYAGSMKELKAAQRERKKGLADLAVAQRAAARGDFDQAQARKEKGLDRIAAAQDTTIGLVADAYKMDADQRFQLRKLTIEMDNRMKVAQVGASGRGGAGGGAAGMTLKELGLRKQILATQLAQYKNQFGAKADAARAEINAELSAINAQLGGSQPQAPAGPAIPTSAFGNLQVR